MLPNLIYAGAPKAGSSTLCAMLGKHPDVFIPKGNKEVFFFDFNYEKGISWYEKHFEGSESKKCVLDATVWYMRMPGVPDRIARTLPGVKILFVLRDPVKRAWSNYWHDYSSLFHLNQPMEEVLFGGKDSRGVIRAGFYHKLVGNWRNALPESPVKILLFEEFLEKPDEVWREICDFAGIRKIPAPALEREMVAMGPQSKLGYRFLEMTQKAVPAAADFFTRFCRRHPKALHLLFSPRQPASKAPQDIHDKLVQIYREDTEKFFSEVCPRARRYWKSFEKK